MTALVSWIRKEYTASTLGTSRPRAYEDQARRNSQEGTSDAPLKTVGVDEVEAMIVLAASGPKRRGRIGRLQESALHFMAN